MTTTEPADQLKRRAAEAAVGHVRHGQIIGLGTGSTAKYMVLALGDKVRAGLAIKGVPTSTETAELARSQGIELLNHDQAWQIDVAIDGADQVDPQLNLIKGGGGALLREKIVAAAARQFIVVVDASKRVPALGGAFPLPIEVAVFGWRSTERQIQAVSDAFGYGGTVLLREKDGQPFQTEAGNYILDLHVPRIDDPAGFETRLNEIPGVVETGLFVGRTDILIVGTQQGIEVRQAERR
ncbi:MAG: ribose-5-phosphate isomerase RpiA [Nitrospirota bacterium]|nr:ribose-5-phosphate isomerase RpiA [Nitrospirota bacterium]MDE3244395.1 ribose-5-phosphate isomerase RpiA [Nitrospirota bacterium]